MVEDERSFLGEGRSLRLWAGGGCPPLVFDPEVGPERPPDDLGLGAAFLLRPRFKQAGLVLVEVAHLPDEPGSGEGLPGSFRLLALRHARKDTGFRCLL